MQCKFTTTHKHQRLKQCIHCGRRIVSNSPPERIFARCTARRGLGDLVANVLKRFGLTPARWSRWTARRSVVCGGGATAILVSVHARQCGCQRRREALNRRFPLGSSQP
jgi:hypothetical protein